MVWLLQSTGRGPQACPFLSHLPQAGGRDNGSSSRLLSTMGCNQHNPACPVAFAFNYTAISKRDNDWVGVVTNSHSPRFGLRPPPGHTRKSP